jgi:shikimate kinase
MRIYLVGYMGSGKTTLGKKLAKQMKYAFIDLDHVIEKQQDRKINQIFESDGEIVFRDIEKTELQKTVLLENTIISCGGGTPCFFDNMDWMNQHGVTLYLQMTVEGLCSRLCNGREERPLLKNLNPQEVKNFIALNLAKREPFYLQAQHCVNGEGVDVRAIASLVLSP